MLFEVNEMLLPEATGLLLFYFSLSKMQVREILLKCQCHAQQPKQLPDKVLAEIIAKRIVAKNGAEKMTGKKKSGTRRLADLARELDWE